MALQLEQNCLFAAYDQMNVSVQWAYFFICITELEHGRNILWQKYCLHARLTFVGNEESENKNKRIFILLF